MVWMANKYVVHDSSPQRETKDGNNGEYLSGLQDILDTLKFKSEGSSKVANFSFFTNNFVTEYVLNIIFLTPA